MGDQSRRDRAGRRQRPDGLVRPYVPPAEDAGSASGGPRGAGGRRPAWSPDDLILQPRSGLTGPPGSPDPPDPPGQSGRDRGDPPASGPATRPLPSFRQTARRPESFIAGLAAVTITIAAILVISRHPSHSLASACTTGSCHRADPRTPAASRPASPSSSPAASPHASKKHPASPSAKPSRTSEAASPSPSPTRTRSSPKPSPTRSPTPSPSRSSPARSVHVSYTLARQWPNGFQGEFTIVNNGTAQVSGWELDAGLPGDRVFSVWGALFHMSGNTLVIDPQFDQQPIAPGASLTAVFTASGPTTTPTSCTFNGKPC